ncbi:hypothetical protein BofuT4_uP139290.1 [Botrytis cinerea T4]|uniref:Uncharacterized protein n=1 Tax=Botryotinia fuckeliana (strain T4) TaxID=999810 RepID=G2YN07_BOTF4|nr:hypothetical protein BofuT4_uP139290.1 [Botrytis cinerea T4]
MNTALSQYAGAARRSVGSSLAVLVLIPCYLIGSQFLRRLCVTALRGDLLEDEDSLVLEDSIGYVGVHDTVVL